MLCPITAVKKLALGGGFGGDITTFIHGEYMKKILLGLAIFATVGCQVQTRDGITTWRLSNGVIKAMGGTPPTKAEDDAHFEEIKAKRNDGEYKYTKADIKACSDWCTGPEGPQGVSGMTSCLESCRNDGHGFGPE